MPEVVEIQTSFCNPKGSQSRGFLCPSTTHQDILPDLREDTQLHELKLTLFASRSDDEDICREFVASPQWSHLVHKFSSCPTLRAALDILQN